MIGENNKEVQRMNFIGFRRLINRDCSFLLKTKVLHSNNKKGETIVNCQKNTYASCSCKYVIYIKANLPANFRPECLKNRSPFSGTPSKEFLHKRRKGVKIEDVVYLVD